MLTPIANSPMKAAPGTANGSPSLSTGFGAMLANLSPETVDDGVSDSPGQGERSPSKATCPLAALSKGTASGIARAQNATSVQKGDSGSGAESAALSVFLPASMNMPVLPQIDLAAVVTPKVVAGEGVSSVAGEVAAAASSAGASVPARGVELAVDNPDELPMAPISMAACLAGPQLADVSWGSPTQISAVREIDRNTSQGSRVESPVFSRAMTSNVQDSPGESDKSGVQAAAPCSDNQPETAWIISENSGGFLSTMVDETDNSAPTTARGDAVISVPLLEHAPSTPAPSQSHEANVPNGNPDVKGIPAPVVVADSSVPAQIVETKPTAPSTAVPHANSPKPMSRNERTAPTAAKFTSDTARLGPTVVSSSTSGGFAEKVSKPSDPGSSDWATTQASASKNTNAPTIVMVNPQTGAAVSADQASGAVNRSSRGDSAAKAQSDSAAVSPVMAFQKPDVSDSPGQAGSHGHESQGTSLQKTDVGAVALSAIPSPDASRPAANISATQSAAPETAKAHQVLDTAAAIHASAQSSARITEGQNGDLQMHVALRTSAFGTVEIHTLVQQNQVGLAIHGDRGLPHWLGSEVNNLASGLKENRLNLATVELNNSSGLHAGTGSHHDQSQNRDLRPAFVSANTGTHPEAEPIDPATQSLDCPENRVSIRV